MFSRVLLRRTPLSLSITTTLKPVAFPSRVALSRAFSATAIKKSADHGHGHDAPPQLLGPGGRAGEVPTDFEQATGLERFELLHEMEGEEAFDLAPLKVDRMGTMEDPIKVWSLDTERIVGCNGFPVDSHDTMWMTVRYKRRPSRCFECGCVYSLDYHGPPVHEEDLAPEKTWASVQREYHKH
ncbi:COX5B-domain-containing protein [Atractiella rhizophila]|nr:COX5B-domain-containing protein [Atractiella rhizophila]